MLAETTEETPEGVTVSASASSTGPTVYIEAEWGDNGTNRARFVLPGQFAIPARRWRLFVSQAVTGAEVGNSVLAGIVPKFAPDGPRALVLVLTGEAIPPGVITGKAGPAGATVDGTGYGAGATVPGPGSRRVDAGFVTFTF